MITGIKYKNKTELLAALEDSVSSATPVGADDVLQSLKDLASTMQADYFDTVTGTNYTLSRMKVGSKYTAIIHISNLTNAIIPEFTVDMVPAGLGQFFKFQEYTQAMTNNNPPVGSGSGSPYVLFNTLIDHPRYEKFQMLGFSGEGRYVSQVLNTSDVVPYSYGGTYDGSRVLPKIQSAPITMTYYPELKSNLSYVIILEGLIL